ncbi:MAG: ABC transporter permease [Phycisphaerae bacterium]|nr:ABC transporter permease [Phycisphaerae bacterium]
MRALLWKDCRVNLFVLVFGAAMLLLPFLAGLTHGIYGQWRYGAAPWWQYDVWMVLSLASLGCSLFTMALLGGNAVASERADRSAEFLAYLPPSRRAIIASKVILAVGACLLVWIINLAIIYGLGPLLPDAEGEASRLPGDRFTDAVPYLASTAVILFGVAWFCSSFLASPAIATGIGIFAPVLVAGALQAIEYFFHPAFFEFGRWYNTACVVLGILGFAAGTGYYLRRIEP